MQDKNVASVIDKLHIRSRKGMQEYGVSTNRANLSKLEWLKHAQDEALDFAVYLEQLIRLETE